MPEVARAQKLLPSTPPGGDSIGRLHERIGICYPASLNILHRYAPRGLPIGTGSQAPPVVQRDPRDVDGLPMHASLIRKTVSTTIGDSGLTFGKELAKLAIAQATN